MIIIDTTAAATFLLLPRPRPAHREIFPKSGWPLTDAFARTEPDVFHEQSRFFFNFLQVLPVKSLHMMKKPG